MLTSSRTVFLMSVGFRARHVHLWLVVVGAMLVTGRVERHFGEWYDGDTGTADIEPGSHRAELGEALDMTVDQLAYTRRVAQETISLTGRSWTWSNKGAINEMRRDRRVRVHWDAPG